MIPIQIPFNFTGMFDLPIEWQFVHIFIRMYFMSHLNVSFLLLELHTNGVYVLLTPHE